MPLLLEQLQGILVALLLDVIILRARRAIDVRTLLPGPVLLHDRIDVFDAPGIGCPPHCHGGQGSNANAPMLAMAAKEDQVQDGHLGLLQHLAQLTEHILQNRPAQVQDVHKDPGTGAPVPLHRISGTSEIPAVNEHASLRMD